MNNKTCAMCGASMDANAQVCPTCGFQQSQQPQAYQMGAQQPAQQMPQQPVQQQMPQQQMNQQAFGNVQQPVVQQQPMAQPVLPQQLQQPFGGAQPNQVDPNAKGQSPIVLVGGFALIILGWFFAGIICSSAALSVGLSYKGKSPLKWVLVVLAGLELLLCIVGIALSKFA